jgi:predicted GNAT family acetyltransferase
MVQTSINESVLSVGETEAASCLGRALADEGTRSLGVVGPAAMAEAAAAAFAARAGVSVRLERNLLLHQLNQSPSLPPARVSLRPAAPADAPLLRKWAAGFERDTRTPEHVRNTEQRVRQGVESGRLFVLEVGCEPVAAASWGRPTGRMRTITCVYTPPERRGRGHGREITALLAARLFREGADKVLIFTDADDPVPNRCYAAVGFVRIAAFSHLRFEQAGV